MNLLIVGGAGYVGGYLSTFLHQQQHTVTVYDNLLYETQYLKNIPFVYGDVCDTKKLISVSKDFDAVIWLAAIVGDAACNINKSITEQVNFQSIRDFSDKCSKKIIFTSTCSVYGSQDGNVDETTTPNPLTLYAETKLEAEQYLLKNHSNNLIFRLGTLYGVSDSISRIRLDLVVNKFAQQAATGQPLSIFGKDLWRPLLHVKDVAHIVYHGLNHQLTGIYNVLSSNYTINDLAQQVVKLIPNTNLNYPQTDSLDIRSYKVSNKKLVSTNFINFLSLADGIKEIEKICKEQRIPDMDHIVFNNGRYLTENLYKKYAEFTHYTR